MNLTSKSDNGGGWGLLDTCQDSKAPCFTQCLSDHTLRLFASGDQLRELEGLLAVVDRKTDGWQGEGVCKSHPVKTEEDGAVW